MTKATNGGADPRGISRGWASAGSGSKLAVIALAGGVGAVVTVLAGAWKYAPLTGWDAAAVVFSAWAWVV